MYTKNLISGWALVRAMKFGSLTLALSPVLETVGLLTGHSEGVFPKTAFKSLSRNAIKNMNKYAVIRTY